MNVNGVEATWLLINVVAGFIIASNLVDAWSDYTAVRSRGIVYRIQSWANVRREILSLMVVAGFLLVSFPALTIPGETPITAVLLAFIAVALVFATNSWLDRRTRRRIRQLIGGRRSTDVPIDREQMGA